MALSLGWGDTHPFSKVHITDKASVQELLRTLLSPLTPFFSPGRARVRCPGGTATRFDQTASEVEGFCRPLWGLASLLAGGGDFSAADLDLWIQGVKAGTDPTHPEYWGYPSDNDQRMVEMCPLGFTLAVAPQFWDALNAQERANVEAWLGNSINEKNMPNTNWLWFRVFANLGLKQNGTQYSQERLESDIEHLNTFYRGDGWSNDGPEGIHQMDYYSSSFAIHFLQLLYAKLATDPERAVEFKKRAQLAALDLVHYYDREGRAIPFGRSLVYRFAVVSFWGAMAYAGVELPAPLTWGMVKGIVLRNLRWWQTQNDMWTSSGTLSLGYSYPSMYITENYNSPGSVYWSCLAFICLAVPDDHPFWTSVEEPISNVLPKMKSIPHPGHIVSYKGGHCMLLSSGQACGYPMKATHAKYGAFAYSSAYGYSVPSGLLSLEQYSLASQLGVSDDGGEYWKTRRLSEYSCIEDRQGSPVLVSIWKPFPDVTVRTLLVPPSDKSPNWHLRAHHIVSGRKVMTADGAFAIRNVNTTNGRFLDLYDAERCEGSRPKILGNYDVNDPDGWEAGKVGAFAVSSGAVGIKALEPMEQRRGVLVNADPNTNLLESRTTIPTLQGEISPGQAIWYISGIYANPAGDGVSKQSYLDGWEAPPELPGWLVGEMQGGM